MRPTDTGMDRTCLNHSHLFFLAAFILSTCHMYGRTTITGRVLRLELSCGKANGIVGGYSSGTFAFMDLPEC